MAFDLRDLQSFILDSHRYNQSNAVLKFYLLYGTFAAAAQAQKLTNLSRGKKKRSHLRRAATFGGKKGVAELEALFAKTFWLKEVDLSGGTSFSRWPRGSSRAKGRYQGVPDVYLAGRHYVTMHRRRPGEGQLVRDFSMGDQSDVIFLPKEAVMVYSRLRHPTIHAFPKTKRRRV